MAAVTLVEGDLWSPCLVHAPSRRAARCRDHTARALSSLFGSGSEIALDSFGGRPWRRRGSARKIASRRGWKARRGLFSAMAFGRPIASGEMRLSAIEKLEISRGRRRPLPSGAAAFGSRSRQRRARRTPPPSRPSPTHGDPSCRAAARSLSLPRAPLPATPLRRRPSRRRPGRRRRTLARQLRRPVHHSSSPPARGLADHQRRRRRRAHLRRWERRAVRQPRCPCPPPERRQPASPSKTASSKAPASRTTVAVDFAVDHTPPG
jgi:hypothetical protein